MQHSSHNFFAAHVAMLPEVPVVRMVSKPSEDRLSICASASWSSCQFGWRNEDWHMKLHPSTAILIALLCLRCMQAALAMATCMCGYLCSSVGVTCLVNGSDFIYIHARNISTGIQYQSFVFFKYFYLACHEQMKAKIINDRLCLTTSSQHWASEEVRRGYPT